MGKVPKTIDQSGTIQSDVAEVAWFVRGRTLYRRVLLVAPAVNLAGVPAAGFYANYDISVDGTPRRIGLYRLSEMPILDSSGQQVAVVRRRGGSPSIESVSAGHVVSFLK